MAECMLAIGQATPALDELTRARQALSDGDLIGQVTLLRSIVNAHRALGQFEAALAAFGEMHDAAMTQARARADLQAWTLRHQQELEHERQRAQRAELMAEVERLSAARWEAEAHHDPLTGLANRRFVSARMEVLTTHAQRSGQPLLAALIDLDHFKAVNDDFGHEVGDRVLRALGMLLQQHVRPRDTPARIGGEEFLVLLSETDPQQAITICERLRTLIAEFAWSDIAVGLRLTASIGLAAVGGLGAPFQAADQALYRAKAEGRNRLVADL
jgi:diguanylate cyclase (GGDEF)-like protein